MPNHLRPDFFPSSAGGVFPGRFSGGRGEADVFSRDAAPLGDKGGFGGLPGRGEENAGGGRNPARVGPPLLGGEETLVGSPGAPGRSAPVAGVAPEAVGSCVGDRTFGARTGLIVDVRVKPPIFGAV